MALTLAMRGRPLLHLRPITSIVNWTRRILKISPWKPISINNPNFQLLAASTKFEEEIIDDISDGRYYPVRIGEVLQSRYQVAGKLGFGFGSTVWLARDLQYVLCNYSIRRDSWCKRKRHIVAVKVFTNDLQNVEEINIYNHMKSIKSKHPGQINIRTTQDAFSLQGPKGEHKCVVHEPMWDSVLGFMMRMKRDKLTEILVKSYIFYAVKALDFLHTEARLIHTGESITFR